MNIYKNNSLYSLLLTSILFALYSSVTNYIPFNALCALYCLFFPAIISYYQRVPREVFACFTLLLYFFLHTLIYHPPSLAEYSFYRRDGNVFISLSPLLFFACIPLRVNIEQEVKKFIFFALSLNVFVFTLLFLFSPHKVSPTYHSLFHAHNAAGGFLSIISALSIALFLDKRSFPSSLLVFTSVFFLMASHSRGSILAVFFATFQYLLFKSNRRLLFCLTLIALNLLISFWGYQVWKSLGEPLSYVDQAVSTVSSQSRVWTVLDRVCFLWPRAMEMFFLSPFLGCGFGSYNDILSSKEGWPYLFMFSQAEDVRFSSAHAHHSFWHILAETGIIGLIFTIYFFYTLQKCHKECTSPWLKKALYLIFWVHIWSSFTEHRLFTPSQTLPLIYIYSLYLAHRNTQVPKKLETRPSLPAKYDEQWQSKSLQLEMGHLKHESQHLKI